MACIIFQAANRPWLCLGLIRAVRTIPYLGAVRMCGLLMRLDACSSVLCWPLCANNVVTLDMSAPAGNGQPRPCDADDGPVLLLQPSTGGGPQLQPGLYDH
jgi:hypothetical protein